MLFRRGQRAEARLVFERLFDEQARGTRAAAAFYLGRISLDERRYDESVRWLEKAVDLDGDLSEYHLWLGRAYGRKALSAGVLRRPFLARRVKKHFEKAVALEPENLAARFALAEYYVSAPRPLGGSRRKAQDQADQIKRRDPAQGHEAWGMIHESAGDRSAAEVEYRAAIEANPRAFDAYERLAALYEGAGEYERARQVLEGGLAADPKRAKAYYEIGRLGAAYGAALERAQDCLVTYLGLSPGPQDPTPAAAHYLLGQVYQRRARLDLAGDHYRRALSLDPGHEGARRALARLQRASPRP